ncbi:MAG: tRNA-dihydrouridine synthase [Candidatus Liptonbacteria bacterium]
MIMRQGFWNKLKRPFFVLAPMLDVTDAAFRRIIAKYSKYNGKFTRHSPHGSGPDVIWTEFVSADGLVSEAGHKKLEHLLWFTEKERPILAQLFGANPSNFEKAARVIRKMGFDGIDINMGCPDKKVVKTGAGAALCNNPKLSRQIILATKRGAGRLPVSVKIRTGDGKNILRGWLSEILRTRPAAITIHFRTRKEMSVAPAHWELAHLAMELSRKYAKGKRRTFIIGNGDVTDLKDARAKAEKYGLDGVMIGRGVFGNPWLFGTRKKPPPRAEKLKVLLEHARLYEKIFRGIKPFDVMKHHFKAYISGFRGAKKLRIRLMGAKSAREAAEAVHSFMPTKPTG